MTRSEKELLGIIKHRDAEIELARGEIEERDHLLRATKSAIERLQAELTSSRADSEAVKEDLRKVSNQLLGREGGHARDMRRHFASNTVALLPCYRLAFMLWP